MFVSGGDVHPNLLYNQLNVTPSKGTWNYNQAVVFIVSRFLQLQIKIKVPTRI